MNGLLDKQVWATLWEKYAANLWGLREEVLTQIGNTTLMMGISVTASVLFGGMLGIALYVTAPGQMLENSKINRMMGYIVDFMRAFPFVILMIAMSPFTKTLIQTSIGPVAAAIVLSIAGIFYFSRLVEQSLREVPRGILEAADAMGAPPMTVIIKILLTEARSGLVLSVTILVITLLSASAAAGMIGGGGLGDLAIRYGYYRYQTDVIVLIVAILSVMVMAIQGIGNRVATRLDKR